MIAKMINEFPGFYTLLFCLAKNFLSRSRLLVETFDEFLYPSPRSFWGHNQWKLDIDTHPL